MEAIDLLAQGKRDLVCGEIPKAVSGLQDACKKLAEKFGETADECAEAYLVYGKALLELSRMESGVFGNALDGMEDGTSTDDDKATTDDDKATTDDDKTTTDDDKTVTDDDKASIDIDTSSVDEKISEGTDDNTEEKADSSEVDAKEGEGTGDEGTTEKGEGTSEKSEEEDISTLQIAWEMLELSKIIYEKNINKPENKKKLADTYLTLGEVGLETEQYETAICDFKDCLRVQKDILAADDRSLAETYYQLGLACSLHSQYDEAVSYYKDASNTIESKIASLKKVVEEGEKEGKGKEQANPNDPIVKSQKELKDLEEIIPDILAKIEDVLDEKRSAEKVKQMLKENITTSSSMETDTSTTTTGFDNFSDTTVPTEPSGPAKDITHLVRKKRKPEDGVEDATKKAKTEENGSGEHVNDVAKDQCNKEETKAEVATS